MKKYPIVVVDNMDCYIAFATQDDAKWYNKAWPQVTLETAFTLQGIEYDKIIRNGNEVGIRYHYN